MRNEEEKSTQHWLLLINVQRTHKSGKEVDISHSYCCWNAAPDDGFSFCHSEKFDREN